MQADRQTDRQTCRQALIYVISHHHRRQTHFVAARLRLCLTVCLHVCLSTLPSHLRPPPPLCPSFVTTRHNVLLPSTPSAANVDNSLRRQSQPINAHTASSAAANCKLYCSVRAGRAVAWRSNTPAKKPLISTHYCNTQREPRTGIWRRKFRNTQRVQGQSP